MRGSWRIDRGVNRTTALTCPIVPDLANGSEQFLGGAGRSVVGSLGRSVGNRKFLRRVRRSGDRANTPGERPAQRRAKGDSSGVAGIASLANRAIARAAQLRIYSQ